MDHQVGGDELAAFERMVQRLRALPLDDPARRRGEEAAASFARESRNKRRKAARRALAEADAVITAGTATGALDRREDAPLAEGAGRAGVFSRPRHCYVCKRHYRHTDGFYHRLCPGCAADGTARRSLSTDLTGRRVLLTGGRVKIGFQLALMMLRDGAEVLVTTRFPEDARKRFRAAEGSERWFGRLTVVAIDLRDPRQVLGLCERLRAAAEPLDILVNNAAQTIRRPPGAYALLAAGERETPGPGVIAAPGYAPMAAIASGGLDFSPVRADTAPPDAGAVAMPDADAYAARTDEAGLLPDLAAENSWSAVLGRLDPAELLEAQLVNALAPALLADRLLPLLLASPRPRRYIVNVSAVEGRFAVRNKTERHPHTNMAKAALNMLTRTSAGALARQGVHMCSVDTGWITDENPAPRKARIAAHGTRTPLDVVDGAARIYDPIVRGEAGSPVAGVFLKDYREADW
ncbi:SDR family NAD(P)-dependent oxidoreductase [Streptomyces sp. CAU 1734]|uniref:SDR family NAD(P)-dependent oxidoreductase n=1 Tax=Streptomyces sp. CAU 1734 TaxID=3140360 RepID=UPI00325FEA87